MMNQSSLQTMHQFIVAQMPQVRAVSIQVDGKLVFDTYLHQESAQTAYPLFSMTKGVLSALVGIALREGCLKSLDQKLVDFYPEYITDRTSAFTRQITLEHLLTMTSGLDLTGAPDTPNFFQLALELPVSHTPGDHFSYSDLDPHLVSGILSKATGRPALDFADEYLFGPLGIPRPAWAADPHGVSVGCSELSLTVPDMAKIAALYLQDGDWNGKQLVPAEWVARSTQKRSEGGWPYFANYGYLWWVIERADLRAFFAGGYGGQFIFCVPVFDLTVVITSSFDQPFIQENWNLIQNYILPVFMK